MYSNEECMTFPDEKKWIDLMNVFWKCSEHDGAHINRLNREQICK